jgi:hypothetical protein
MSTYRPSPAMIQKAKTALEQKAGRRLTEEEAREACVNLVGFAQVLAEWKAKAEAKKRKGGKIPA